LSLALVLFACKSALGPDFRGKHLR
jgi:hypothetical protein